MGCLVGIVGLRMALCLVLRVDITRLTPSMFVIMYANVVLNVLRSISRSNTSFIIYVTNFLNHLLDLGLE